MHKCSLRKMVTVGNIIQLLLQTHRNHPTAGAWLTSPPDLVSAHENAKKEPGKETNEAMVS